MIGNGYWATGMVLTYRRGDWQATVKFYDDGFCNDDVDLGKVSTVGEIGSRYFVRDGAHATALATVIDVVIADAERLGIAWRMGPFLYMEEDGESTQFPPPPSWRELLWAQARRVEWIGP